jgi:hypothetical protein
VYNITLNPWSKLHINSVDSPGFPYLRRPSSQEVVYVFTPGPPETWCTARGDPGETSYNAASLLNSLINVFVLELHAHGADSTVVGIDALARLGTLNIMGRRDFTNDPQGMFLTLCGELLHRMWRGIDRLEVSYSLDRVKFLSLDEYRKEVGPERAALETCESGVL